MSEYFYVDWAAFLSRYLLSDAQQIFVMEEEDKYVFYTCVGVIKLMSEYPKSEDMAADMIFIDRYLGRGNILKVSGKVSLPYPVEVVDGDGFNIHDEMYKEQFESLEVEQKDGDKEKDI